jgi:predicted porin
MTSLRKLLLPCVLAAANAYAVYAPIPEQEQGKALSCSFKTGASYDSNIFGSAKGAIDSSIITGSAKLSFNASLDEQSFGSAFYQATLDHYLDRPGEKNLTSHDLFARLAHSFSQVSTIDVMDYFQISKNPESLLAGLPLNTDQSFKRNQLDLSGSTAVTQKASVTAKFRNVIFNYDDVALGKNLDRTENLYGLAGSYGILPETKAVLEYRHQDIRYDNDPATKNKKSEYALLGVDQKTSDKMTLSARLGAEWRNRKGENSTTSPSAELSMKYDYTKESFVSAGYSYTIEEASNVAQYTDTKVNRLFLNFQHSLSPVLVGSASLTYEPSSLQGRTGFADISEQTLRFGVGLSYVPDKNWTISLTFDLDKVNSDDSSREMDRDRVALMAVYSF